MNIITALQNALALLEQLGYHDGSVHDDLYSAAELVGSAGNRSIRK